jgi:ABC-type Zn2+ transport system substrate-binding protein/surface adhesin
MCREGLNLQDNYSEAYLPSPHFNPATEQQAIARCWRIGQKKEVNVFRYIQSIGPLSEQEQEQQQQQQQQQQDEDEEADEEADDEADEAADEADEAEDEFNPRPITHPQTMDMFAANLHIKKQKYVELMADQSTTTACRRTIKI